MAGHRELDAAANELSTSGDSSEGEHIQGSAGPTGLTRVVRGSLALVGLGAVAVLLHASFTGRAEEFLVRVSSKNTISEQAVAARSSDFVQVARSWCDHGEHAYKTSSEAQAACRSVGAGCIGVYSLRCDPKYGYALCAPTIPLQLSQASSCVFQKASLASTTGTSTPRPELTTMGKEQLEQVVETFNIPKDQIKSTDCKIAVFAMAKGMCTPGTGLKPTCAAPKQLLDQSCEQWYGAMRGVGQEVITARVKHCKDTARRAAQAQDAVRVISSSKEEEHICVQCDLDACSETPTWILAQERAQPVAPLPAGATTAPPDGGPNHCRPMLNGQVLGVQIRTRKEILQWTDAEFAKFSKALNQLRAVRGGLTQDLVDYPNTYGAFVAAHPLGHPPNKAGPFLTWHRRFLMDLETQLQKISGDCSLTLPYWNSNLEAGQPLASFVWDAKRYGGKGGSSLQPAGPPCKKTDKSTREDGYCLVDGIAGGWKVNARQGAATCAFCVHRSPAQTIKLAAWTEVMGHLMSTTSLDDVNNYLEDTHVPVHTQLVGGSMGDLYVSPRDPVFFLHHAYVDRLFNWWQRYHSARGRDTSKAGFDPVIMGLFNEKASEWIGVHDLALGCTMLPKTNPRYCLKYISEMPVPEKEA